MATSLTRRAFLERTTLASATIALAGRRAHALAPSMFVSLNSALTRNVGWPEFAHLAARTGYGGADWAFGPARTAGIDATRALFAELQLRPTIVNLPMTQPFGGDTAAFAAKLADLDDAAKFTAAIGCRHMMTVLSPASALPRAEQRALVRERLAAIGDVLGRSNIRLGLEFLGVESFRTRPGTTPFIWTLPDTIELAADSGPNIGAVLDAWHWHHSGGTTADIVAAGASRIVHVHVSDAARQPPADVRDNQRLMPGEGAIDLMGFFQALKTIGYTDGVSPEPLGRVPADMSAEDGARLGLETTMAVMKKAGVA